MASSRSLKKETSAEQGSHRSQEDNEAFDDLVRRFAGGTIGNNPGGLVNFGAKKSVPPQHSSSYSHHQEQSSQLFARGNVDDVNSNPFGFGFGPGVGSPSETGQSMSYFPSSGTADDTGNDPQSTGFEYSGRLPHQHTYTAWYDSLPSGPKPVQMTTSSASYANEVNEYDSLDVEAFLYDENSLAHPSQRSSHDGIPPMTGQSTSGYPVNFNDSMYSVSSEYMNSTHAQDQMNSMQSHSGDLGTAQVLSQSFPQPASSPAYINRPMIPSNLGYSGGVGSRYQMQPGTHGHVPASFYASQDSYGAGHAPISDQTMNISGHYQPEGSRIRNMEYNQYPSQPQQHIHHDGIAPPGYAPHIRSRLDFSDTRPVNEQSLPPQFQQQIQEGLPYSNYYPGNTFGSSREQNPVRPPRGMNSNSNRRRDLNHSAHAGVTYQTQHSVSTSGRIQRHQKQPQRNQQSRRGGRQGDLSSSDHVARSSDVNRNRSSRTAIRAGKHKNEMNTSGRSRNGNSRGSQPEANFVNHPPVDQTSPRKRTDMLQESSSTKPKLKEFQKTFRVRDKEGFNQAFTYAKESLESLPEEVHWRVFLELADLCKRENKFSLARKFYQKVNKMKPSAAQGWLEYSKMEEECGELPHCQEILHQGLHHCSFSEPLLTKAIKHEERMGNLQGARSLLARLRTQNIDKAWKTVLEGALLEARAGHKVIARKVFKYLMKNVPWYGPIYHEAARFEERNEEYGRAIANVERGLVNASRYGPLWFTAFRLTEKKEMQDAENAAMHSGDSLLRVPVKFWKEGILSDLKSKFGMKGDELGMRIRTCKLDATLAMLEKAYGSISKELVWKVHFEAAQACERGGGEGWLEQTRQSYVQSVLRCPLNLRWKVWLAGARTELAAGNVSTSRQLLLRALDKVPEKSRSQVLLERSRLEEYTGNLEAARKVLNDARRETRHEWKVFLESVMLEVRAGNRDTAIAQAEKAIEIHPGTGRLWAIVVQLKHVQGPDAQRQVFRNALKEVPKSGEVWCEGARVCLHPLSPHFNLHTAERFLQFAIQFTPQYGDSFIEALRLQLMLCDDEDTPTKEAARKAMELADTTVLEQRCVNADPNYGALWFHCKRGPFDTARQVLRVAKRLLIAELIHFRRLLRHVRGLKTTEEKQGQMPSIPFSNTERHCKDQPNLWITERVALLPEQNYDCFDFSTGLVHVNWFRERMADLLPEEQRKILFDSDQIVP